MRILIKTCKWETVEKHVTTRSLYKTIDFYNGVSLTKEYILYEKNNCKMLSLIIKDIFFKIQKKRQYNRINNIDYKINTNAFH
jgi:hypothetical protein